MAYEENVELLMRHAEFCAVEPINIKQETPDERVYCEIHSSYHGWLELYVDKHDERGPEYTFIVDNRSGRCWHSYSLAAVLEFRE